MYHKFYAHNSKMNKNMVFFPFLLLHHYFIKMIKTLGFFCSTINFFLKKCLHTQKVIYIFHKKFYLWLVKEITQILFKEVILILLGNFPLFFRVTHSNFFLLSNFLWRKLKVFLVFNFIGFKKGQPIVSMGSLNLLIVKVIQLTSESHSHVRTKKGIEILVFETSNYFFYICIPILPFSILYFSMQESRSRSRLILGIHLNSLF